MRHRPLTSVALACLALRSPVARADDPAAAATDEPFEVRIHGVGAITTGRSFFANRGEKGFLPIAADQVNDEENPLFGGESEESSKLFGSIDDVIELVKSEVHPAFSKEGSLIGAMGTLSLFVRATRATQELVARSLAAFERAALRTVTIDVVAVRGDARAADEGGFGKAIARGELVALAGARSSGGIGGGISARCGAEVAYVQDQDVEVAQEAYLSDPIVSILKGGLHWSAEMNGVVGETVAIRFEGWWSKPGTPDRIELTKSREPVERITGTAHRAFAQLDLRVGRWTLLETAGDVAFAIRATVREHDGPIPAPPVFGAGFPTSVEGPRVSRLIDIRDLTTRIPSRRGRERRLSLSNYTPPEPPELHEPAPRVPSDGLIESIRAVAPALVDDDDIVLRTNGDFLDVRAPAAHVEAIERLVADERRRVFHPIRIRGVVVALPLASIPEYLALLDDGATLVADGGMALLARKGARVIDRASVLVAGPGRSVSEGGRLHRYVGDYDVEIAVGAQIGNPITFDFLDGLRFEVSSASGAAPDTMYAELCLDRASWRGSRIVPTPSGDLECPTIGISRVRGGTLVRVGAPRIVGATLEGGVVTLTILGATFE